MKIEQLKIYLPLYATHANYFKDNPDSSISLLSGMDKLLVIIVGYYSYLAETDEIESIETLDFDVKNKLWNHVKAVCPNVSKDKAIKLSKCIWAFNSST